MLWSALFVTPLCPHQYKSTFQKISAVIVSEIHNVNNFAQITTAVIERDFKSEYLFRTLSIATNLLMSLEFRSISCYYAVPFIDNYGRAPYSLNLIPIAALLQAVLQEKTKPFRNGLVETCNKAIEMYLNDAR